MYVLRLFYSVTNCYIAVPLFCLNRDCTMEKVTSFSIICIFSKRFITEYNNQELFGTE